MDCSFDHSGFLVDARHHHDSSGIKQGRSDLFLESAFELVCFRYRFLGFCHCCIVLFVDLFKNGDNGVIVDV